MSGVVNANFAQRIAQEFNSARGPGHFARKRRPRAGPSAVTGMLLFTATLVDPRLRLLQVLKYNAVVRYDRRIISERPLWGRPIKIELRVYHVLQVDNNHE